VEWWFNVWLVNIVNVYNISTAINIKILTNSNQQTQSYEFTSHIAAFLSGFDHRDAWNLHTNIIWPKRSRFTVPYHECALWFSCSQRFLRGYHTLQGDNSLKSVERFGHMMFVCRFQASRWSKPERKAAMWLVNL
jgi:hypothetical protein